MVALNSFANLKSVHLRYWTTLGAQSGQIDTYCLGKARAILQNLKNTPHFDPAFPSLTATISCSFSGRRSRPDGQR